MNIFESVGVPNVPWWFWVIAGAIFVAGFFLVFLLKRSQQGETLKYFFKKSSIFDTKTEADMYELLVELYGDQFYIFTQVNFTHFIEPNREFEFKEKMRLRSRIDRKSVDFLLCDKDTGAPRLAIELDGGSHISQKRMDRDDLVDRMMADASMPLVHLKADRLDKELIKAVLDKELIGEEVADSSL